MNPSQFSKDFVPLLVDNAVKIGRQSTCDLVIKSPLVSNVHCVVSSSTTPQSSSNEIRNTILDCSRNGTWVGKNTEGAGASSGSPSARIARVSKEVPYNLDIGDVIFLLAPGHVESAKYRFELIKAGIKDYFLYHLDSDDKGGFEQADERRALKRELNKSSHSPKAKLPRTSDADTSATDRSSYLETSSDTEVTFKGKAEEKEWCYICGRLFFVSQLPAHCLDCSRRDAEDVSELEEEEKGQCPNCGILIPVAQLPTHYPDCVERLSDREKVAIGDEKN